MYGACAMAYLRPFTVGIRAAFKAPDQWNFRLASLSFRDIEMHEDSYKRGGLGMITRSIMLSRVLPPTMYVISR